MKQLNLTFKSSLDKNKVQRFNAVDEALPAETVKSAMQKIADTNLFIKEGELLYQKPFAAKYVERIETPIFSNKDA